MSEDALVSLKAKNSEAFSLISRNTLMNLPIGSEDFIKELELKLGKDLRFRPRGRPKKG